MEQILAAYGLPKEIITAIMMLNRNMKINVLSRNEDTDFFNVVVGVLQGDILAPYLFLICLYNVLRTSIDLLKENGFTVKKARSRRYPAETITDADNAGDIALFANTLIQAKSLLHRRRQHEALAST